MTVKELKEILENYNDSDIVEVEGGEDYLGEWAKLYINDETILEGDY